MGLLTLKGVTYMKIYNAKTLFDGHVINKNGKYVAIPSTYKKFKIKATYNGETMIIDNWNNADGYRKFADKFGRKDEYGKTTQYTLGYFRWKPEVEKVNFDEAPKDVAVALSGMPEHLRVKLKEYFKK